MSAKAAVVKTWANFPDSPSRLCAPQEHHSARLLRKREQGLLRKERGGSTYTPGFSPFEVRRMRFLSATCPHQHALAGSGVKGVAWSEDG